MAAIRGNGANVTVEVKQRIQLSQADVAILRYLNKRSPIQRRSAFYAPYEVPLSESDIGSSLVHLEKAGLVRTMGTGGIPAPVGLTITPMGREALENLEALHQAQRLKQ